MDSEEDREELDGESIAMSKEIEVDISFPMVFVTLKSPEKAQGPKKIGLSSSSFIVESLKERQSQTDFKLANLRMAQKAEEFKLIRQTPEINQKSRIIIDLKQAKETLKNQNISVQQKIKDPLLYENFKRHNSMLDIGKKDQDHFPKKKVLEGSKRKIEKIGKNEEKYKVFEPILHSSMSADVFKNIPKTGVLNAPQPNECVKKLSVIDRTKDWKENLEKKKEEKRKERSIQELEECTFKPQLTPKADVNDPKLLSFTTLSTIFATGKNVSQRYISQVDIFPCTYTQISPASYSIKYERGYNFKEFLTRAKPLTKYEILPE